MRSWQSTIMATVMGIGVTLMASAAFAGPGGAPVIYDEDHLKCYRVAKDAMPTGTRVVGMANKQFGPERCKVQKRAAFLCAPTVKFNVNDQNVPNDPLGGQLDTDFLCYKMRCENDLTRSMTVQDQFGTRDIVTQQAQMLCSPAQKIGWPTIPCNNAAAPACSGECPTGYTCDLPDAAAATCQCRPVNTVP